MTNPSRDAGWHGWSGGCQCGAVRYKISAKPYVTVCHCRMCQKAVGGPYAVLAAVDGPAVTWTRGTPSRFRSSDGAERWFCSACGTPLAFADLEDGGIELTVGSLDAPSEATPVAATGVESQLPWVDGVRDLPRRSTEATVASAGRPPPISYQHPDHDTPDGWSAGAASSGRQ
ncbi:GFA family protein [Corallococcus sp. CA047B]|uniref:GFA family protein n=1 Tax=Corallococcus sp. CA047B TaxID=2316729 RepID=UPI000EA10C45|nr:GFA family protein [Corallococcus sp. CA047B]RKH13493.1 GFA family protein [Corallococcus sp. CA047B]